MGTFLVRDGFARHRRFVDVDDAAIGVWVQCLAYANEQETDGFIPAGALRWVSRARDADAQKTMRVLVHAGLLDEVDGGWMLHNYLQHNPSRKEREAKREAARARMASRELRAKEPRSDGEARTKLPRSEREDSEKPPDASLEVPPKQRRTTSEQAGKLARTSFSSVSVSVSESAADAAGAQARAATTTAVAVGRSLETSLAELLRSHTASVSSGLDPDELAKTLAFAGDARKPAHVLAAVRRGLEEAAPQHLTDSRLLKLLRSFAERASERDLGPPPASPTTPDVAAEGPRYRPAAPPPSEGDLAEYAAARRLAGQALAAVRRAGVVATQPAKAQDEPAEAAGDG